MGFVVIIGWILLDIGVPLLRTKHALQCKNRHQSSRAFSMSQFYISCAPCPMNA